MMTEEIGKYKPRGSICGYARTSTPNMVGVQPPTADIRCSTEARGGAGKSSNRYNFGCMTAGDSVFDSVGGFSESSYPTKTLPRSKLLHAAATVKLDGPHSSYYFWPDCKPVGPLFSAEFVCLSVCLSVCVSDRHFYPSMLTDFDETWSQGPYCDLLWPRP